MLGITIYAVNARDREAIEMRENVRSISMQDPAVIGMHGFYLNKVDKTISFEVETDFDARDSLALQNNLISRVSEKYPGYDISLKVNHSIDE